MFRVQTNELRNRRFSVSRIEPLQTVGGHQEIRGTLGSSSILQQALNVDLDGGTDR